MKNYEATEIAYKNGYEAGKRDATENNVGHKTNADRIRAMSDEELAVMFCGLCDSIEICSRCPAQNDCPGTSAAAWTAWLKMEVH